VNSPVVFALLEIGNKVTHPLTPNQPCQLIPDMRQSPFCLQAMQVLGLSQDHAHVNQLEFHHLI